MGNCLSKYEKLFILFVPPITSGCIKNIVNGVDKSIQKCDYIGPTQRNKISLIDVYISYIYRFPSQLC